jgi:hypothetical protein
MARGRLPASEMIKKCHGPSDGICVPCAQPKDVDQIFFNCPLAQFMWSGLRSIFEVSWNPTCFSDIFGIFQRFKVKTRRFLWILFAIQSWALWTRNKFMIESKLPKRPANPIFKTFLLLQHCKRLRHFPTWMRRLLSSRNSTSRKRLVKILAVRHSLV